MKTRVVKSTGGAMCRLCIWGKRNGNPNVRVDKAKAKIPKGDLCLEIETTDAGPTRFGYLCEKHAVVFFQNIMLVMKDFGE